MIRLCSAKSQMHAIAGSLSWSTTNLTGNTWPRKLRRELRCKFQMCRSSRNPLRNPIGFITWDPSPLPRLLSRGKEKDFCTKSKPWKGFPWSHLHLKRWAFSKRELGLLCQALLSKLPQNLKWILSWMRPFWMRFTTWDSKFSIIEIPIKQNHTCLCYQPMKKSL